MCYLTRFFLIRLFVLAITVGQGVTPAQPVNAADIEVEYIKTRDARVTYDLRWSKTSLADAQALLDEAQSTRLDVFDDLKEAGVSFVQIAGARRSVLDADLVGRYPEFDTFNNAWTLTGTAAWGEHKKTTELVPFPGEPMELKLFEFSQTSCRLAWDLFNWNTWFAPDCSLKMASPETLLRSSLILYIRALKPLEGQHFRTLEALTAISESKYEYWVRDGAIVCPSLLEIGYRRDPIPLRELADFGKPGEPKNIEGKYITGYVVFIDSVNKWKFTLLGLGKTIQELAFTARLVKQSGQETFAFSL